MLKYYFLFIRDYCRTWRDCICYEHSYQMAVERRNEIYKQLPEMEGEIAICKPSFQNDGLYDTIPFKMTDGGE